jgi:hypothetical protein
LDIVNFLVALVDFEVFQKLSRVKLRAVLIQTREYPLFIELLNMAKHRINSRQMTVFANRRSM